MSIFADIDTAGILHSIRRTGCSEGPGHDCPGPHWSVGPGRTRVGLSAAPEGTGPYTYDAAAQLAIPDAEATAQAQKDEVLRLSKEKAAIEAAAAAAPLLDYSAELTAIDEQIAAVVGT